MDQHGKRTEGRRYSGMDAADRTLRRRASLLDAALELFGTQGYLATSVKDLCTQAELTERYFYESFPRREDLLLDVYSGLAERLFTLTIAAMDTAGEDRLVRARLGLEAFIRFLLEDPRRARVVLIEVVGVSPAVEDSRNAVMHRFAQVIRGAFLTPPEGDPAATTLPAEELGLMATALVGTVNHVLADSLAREGHPDPGMLVRVCVRLFEAAYSSIFPLA